MSVIADLGERRLFGFRLFTSGIGLSPSARRAATRRRTSYAQQIRGYSDPSTALDFVSLRSGRQELRGADSKHPRTKSHRLKRLPTFL